MGCLLKENTQIGNTVQRIRVYNNGAIGHARMMVTVPVFIVAWFMWKLVHMEPELDHSNILLVMNQARL